MYQIALARERASVLVCGNPYACRSEAKRSDCESAVSWKYTPRRREPAARNDQMFLEARLEASLGNSVVNGCSAEDRGTEASSRRWRDVLLLQGVPRRS